VTFRYALDAPSPIVLTLHDVAGRSLGTLFAGERAAGEHTFRWHRSAGDLRSLPSGVYLVQVAAGSQMRSTKLMLEP
jgi:hypothetical protein